MKIKVEHEVSPEKETCTHDGDFFGERAFAGITPTGIERMAEKLPLSDIFRNVHYLIVDSKGIM